MSMKAKVSNIPYRKPTIVKDSDSLEEVLARYDRSRDSKSLFVTDESSRLMGSISVESIGELLAPYVSSLDSHSLSLLWKKLLSKRVGDLKHASVCQVTDSEQSAASLFVAMLSGSSDSAAVVDDEKRIVGEIHLLDLILFFRGRESVVQPEREQARTGV